MNLQDTPMSEIFPDESFNSRGSIAPIDVVELAKSIEEEGLIQPVVISPLKEGDPRRKSGAIYLLVAGYRRYTAHKVLKRTSIMAVVREEMDEIKCRIINLKENLDRKDLNILQEAKSISRLKELGVGEEYAASALNKSRGWVQVRYMLLDLPEEIQAEAAAGVIRQSDIRSIYSQPDRNLRLAAAKKIKESVIRGESKVEARLKSQPKRATDKRVRNKVEIILMQDRVRDAIGNGIATRALAWCVGEINDGEFFGTIKEVAEDMGLEYTVPKDGEY